MIKSFLDDILLFKAGRTAETLLNKERQNIEKQQGNIRSSELPNGFENKNSIDDIKILEQAFKDYYRLNNKDRRKDIWTWFSVYLVVFKTFKKLYGIYFLLFSFNLGVSYFVKFQAKEFFNLFVSENSSGTNLTNLFSGLFLIILQILSIILTTHCEYYNSWTHFKIQSAISGSALLRFLECKKLKNNQGLCILDNNSSTEILSLYQNIILVDSEFTEYAISNSINIILYPIHILTSALVAHSVFGGTPLILCLISLFTCFSIAAVTQYLSSMYKKPFLKSREERVEETTRLLEQSKYLPVTQQLFPSIHHLITRNRNIELHYNSLRKYICMISEIFDNWITLSCTLVIGSYILFNKLPTSQASLMIIQSVWLIPTFYHPLNDIIFFIYYIIEGSISMERIAKFLFFTQNDPDHDTDILDFTISNSNTNNTISSIVLNNISFSRGQNVNNSVINVNLTLNPNVPCFVLGDISSGKSAFLEGIAGFLINSTFCQKNQSSQHGAGGLFSINLKNGQVVNVSDISSKVLVGYVPQQIWVPSGLPLSDLILCGGEYDEKLWKQVIYQCDLEVDFWNWGIKSYEDAQKLIVTDKQFSAGQKVRLSLARAIYSCLSVNEKKPRIFLVDGVLNSLDPFVCKVVIERLFSKNGLLAGHISIIVIEPPILEFVKQVSNSNGFSYKVVNMSNKVITSTEEVTVNNIKNSCQQILESDSTLMERSNQIENDSHTLLQKYKTQSNERVENISKIDIQKNKFSYYYPTNYFYMFISGSKKFIKSIYQNSITFSLSSIESYIMIFTLILPSIIVKLGESMLLIILREDSVVNLNWDSIEFLEASKLGRFKSILFKIPSFLGYNVLSFWCSFYNTALIISMISICFALLLEIRIGFRAARYFHNSLLLGYLGATRNSVLRWFPLSFILNRLSNDQLHIDYCITRRIRFVIIILNSVIISAIPLIFGSVNSLLTLTLIICIGFSIYYFFIRYFTNGCRTLRSCYISEYSPLVDIIQTIGKGKKCLTSSQIRTFFFETSVNRINSVLKPRFTQICLDAWFKMRIKILLTVPITLINVILPYISNGQESSTRSVVALAIATATGLAPLLSILVGYWTKLETELVSVERCRLYLAASRESGLKYLEYESENNHDKKSENSENQIEIELEDIQAQHSRLDSQGNSNFDNSHLIGTKIIHITNIRGVTAKFKAGEIVGIVGRTGSGKTTLLDVLSNLLICKGGRMTVSGLKMNYNENIINKLNTFGFKFEDFDQIILESIIKSQENLSHIAFLPLEIYFPKSGNIRDIIDPFNEFDLDDIKSALNICGFGSYINKSIDSSCETELLDCDQESALLSENNLILKFLNSRIDEIRFGILQMRMLLFVNFFLKRKKLRILLVDEPPVVLRSQKENNKLSNERMRKDSYNIGDLSSNNSGCILSSVINQYFKHCITFIVSHDIRSLQHVNRILVLSNGKVISDSQFDRNSFTNSELFNLVRTNMDEH